MITLSSSDQIHPTSSHECTMMDGVVISKGSKKKKKKNMCHGDDLLHRAPDPITRASEKSCSIVLVHFDTHFHSFVNELTC